MHGKGEGHNDGGWKAQRTKSFDKVYRAIVANKGADIEAILNMSCDLLKRGLSGLIKREEEVSIAEMAKIGNIVKEFSLLINLKEGKPTSIVHNTVDATPQGLQKLVDELAEVDPYVDYKKEPEVH